jgi:CheY-like chemotaxis protein
MLPDKTGLEFLEDIEKKENFTFPPIIIYTAKDLSEQEVTRLEKWAECIIVKGEKSEDRLLDETSLFLHRVFSSLPEHKQKVIQKLHLSDDAFNSKTILLVDDDMRNVFALSKVLKEQGMNVLKAETGKKAIEIIQSTPKIDLVLMDIMMPEMDGYEAMSYIRNQLKLSDMPIIALTAKAMKDDMKKCIDAGANDYFAKPIAIDKLLSLIRVWIK